MDGQRDGRDATLNAATCAYGAMLVDQLQIPL